MTIDNIAAPGTDPKTDQQKHLHDAFGLAIWAVPEAEAALTQCRDWAITQPDIVSSFARTNPRGLNLGTVGATYNKWLGAGVAAEVAAPANWEAVANARLENATNHEEWENSPNFEEELSAEYSADWAKREERVNNLHALRAVVLTGRPDLAPALAWSERKGAPGFERPIPAGKEMDRALEVLADYRQKKEEGDQFWAAFFRD